jgi:glycyl-tRNA synthetase beta chain
MNQDFLLELGCAELPAGQIDALIEALKKSFETQLKAYGLKFNAGIECFSTPRRLALRIHQLADATEAQTLERRGPSKAQGFDSEGNPSKALLGFLQSANAKIEDLIEVPTDKGIWLAVKVNKPAQKTTDLLPLILNEAIKSLPLKKSMRWGDHSFNFVRPLYWLLMLYGEEIVNAEVFGIKAGRITRGHRFEGDQTISIAMPSEYEQKLEKAFVIASPEKRKIMITEQAQALAGNNETGLHTLNEVVNLVEWPQAILCNFNPKYLEVPQAVLISAMETHQRVFPILDQKKKLTAEFITVSNNIDKDTSEIKLGNEKVISARLSDAEFFYVSDKKIPLEQHLDSLKKISFQEKLGSIYDKVERIKKLSGYLASLPSIFKTIDQRSGLMTENDLRKHAERAAILCKCDLATDMVQEFPELQGQMGATYAMSQGESEDVYWAIENHYKPKTRGGELPHKNTGAILAIADKLDTLVGLFGIGEKPSGSGDPYALRRQALGIIAILQKFNWDIDLVACIKHSHSTFTDHGVKLQPLEQELSEFFLDRMAQSCLDDHPDIATNVVNAVKSKMQKDLLNKKREDLNLLEFLENARALNEILKSVNGEPLLQLVKRAKNIVPNGFSPIGYQELKEPAEQGLVKSYAEISSHMQGRSFTEKYESLLAFKSPLAQFFDDIMVMCDDETLKKQRLSLLFDVLSLFDLLADFSCL